MALLPAVTGNLGKPGTGLLYLNGTGNRGIDEDYLTAAELANGSPEPISHMDLAARLEDHQRAKALLCWNINIAASNPEQARLRRALTRDDLFTVAVDLFATDTADLADCVLPAASFLECDDLVVSYFHESLSAQVKATEPLGQALPNSEIFRRLVAAMGYDEPQLRETDDQVIEEVLRRADVGCDFQTLAAKGTMWLDEEPRVQFADLRFPTPSGLVEIASQQAEADGQPRVPEPFADARQENGRLRLLSPASEWILNDSFANDPKIARRIGVATVALNPDDAAEHGLTEGAQWSSRARSGRSRSRSPCPTGCPGESPTHPRAGGPRPRRSTPTSTRLTPGSQATWVQARRFTASR